MAGGGSCGKVQQLWGGLRYLARGIWPLPHLLAGVTAGPPPTSLQDGWVDRQMDKQRYEGEWRGRKGEGDPQAVLQGLSTACGGRRTKGGGSPPTNPPGLLCLLDKLLLLTLLNRAICGEDKGGTHGYLSGVNAVVLVLGAREETPSSAEGVKKGL